MVDQIVELFHCHAALGATRQNVRKRGYPCRTGSFFESYSDFSHMEFLLEPSLLRIRFGPELIKWCRKDDNMVNTGCHSRQLKHLIRTDRVESYSLTWIIRKSSKSWESYKDMDHVSTHWRRRDTNVALAVAQWSRHGTSKYFTLQRHSAPIQVQFGVHI